MGVSLYQSFQPIFTFIFAGWFLNEPVDIFQITGAITVCFGLFVYLLRKVSGESASWSLIASYGLFHHPLVFGSSRQKRPEKEKETGAKK